MGHNNKSLKKKAATRKRKLAKRIGTKSSEKSLVASSLKVPHSEPTKINTKPKEFVVQRLLQPTTTRSSVSGYGLTPLDGYRSIGGNGDEPW